MAKSMVERQNRIGRQFGSSASFVAGFLMVFLSFGVIRGIFAIVGSFFVFNPPLSVEGGLLSLLCAIIVPIIAGRVWKNKSGTFWTGVSVGLIALFIVLVIWTFLAGVWWEHGELRA
jgi:hypothetical protein